MLVYLKNDLGDENSPNVINFAANTKDRSSSVDFFPSNIQPQRFFWSYGDPSYVRKLFLVLDEGVVVLDSLPYPFNPKEAIAAEILGMSFDVNFVEVTAIFSDGSSHKSQGKLRTVI